MRTSFIINILLVIFLVPAVVGCSLYGMRILLEPPGTFKSGFALSDDPVLGRPVKITLTLDYSPKCGKIEPNPYYEDINQNRYFTARIELPEAFELVDGDLEWQGYLHCGEAPKKIEATIKAAQIGEYIIRAKIDPGTGHFFHHDYHYLNPELFVDVFSDRTFVSNKPITIEGDQPFYADRPPYRHLITVDLSLSDKPLLNKDIEVKCIATATWDTPKAYVSLDIPKGFLIIKDNTKVTKGDATFQKEGSYLMWTGDLVKGDTIELAAIVKPVKTGRWNITAHSSYPSCGQLDFDALRIYIFRDGSDVIDVISTSPRCDVMQLDLSVPSYSKFNETVEVICTFDAICDDISKVRVRLMPNDQYYIIQRNFYLDDNIIANVPIKVTAQIKPIRAGNFNIQVYIENYSPLSNRYILIAWPSAQITVQP